MKVNFYITKTYHEILEIECAMYCINTGDLVCIGTTMYQVKSKCYTPKEDMLQIELKKY